ncbi:hypothetical protein CRM22_004116 [Opisthorchis felineus]|uniref:Uncharacterized protein n=1 Tax=Opisthorchis felineus TaxID=147828 RepID=A0A4S2LXV0_OPIFE|nr:hypothetical protein CRM22_004116 [Opisthorchis felineus]
MSLKNLQEILARNVNRGWRDLHSRFVQRHGLTLDIKAKSLHWLQNCTSSTTVMSVGIIGKANEDCDLTGFLINGKKLLNIFQSRRTFPPTIRPPGRCFISSGCHTFFVLSCSPQSFR